MNLYFCNVCRQKKSVVRIHKSRILIHIFEFEMSESADDKMSVQTWQGICCKKAEQIQYNK